MRTIPSTMASQHPDHAGAPFWQTDAFISTQQEIRECFLAYSELGIPEYKWDWEGKYVDESVIERLLSEYYEYFKENQLGESRFLTFRLPNPKVETEFRMGRALMIILGASSLTEQIKLHTPPLFEVILPMTETPDEMISIQEAYKELTSLKHPLHRVGEATLDHIQVIPLFEQVDTIMNSDAILRSYFELHKLQFGAYPSYMRPYVARSDPALNSGLIPTVLAIKVALSRYRKLAQSSGVAMYPIIGSASLPFRGGLTPYRVKEFANEYQGIRTALIQSAFRYDFPKEDVISALSELDRLLPAGEALLISPADEQEIRLKIPVFELFYRKSIEGVAPLVNTLATHLPKRRERVQHIGLFGYSRGLGDIKLPRAIGFTGAMYSLGIPPEILGTGRGLIALGSDAHIVSKHYVNLRDDIYRAGRYVHKDAIRKFSSGSGAFAGILEDIEAIESFFGEPLGPQTEDELAHAALVPDIYSHLEDSPEKLSETLEQMALYRKSMG